VYNRFTGGLGLFGLLLGEGIEVGPRDGEPTPVSAGLEGIDRVVSLPRPRFCERNLVLLVIFAGPPRLPVAAFGNPEPSLMYFVLFEVN